MCRVARRSSPRWSAVEYGSRWIPSTTTTTNGITQHARDYSVDTKASGKIGQTHRQACGTATTCDPQQTGIDDILGALPNDALSILPPPPEDGAHSRPSLLLCLLTPTYAKDALDATLPPRLLKKLSGTDIYGRPLHTITAVVDRLPGGNNHNAGNEGLAFGWRHQRKRTLLERELPPLMQSEMSASAQKPGWLEFHFTETSHERLQHERRIMGKMTVQVPLAQTIFSNGLASTLVHRLYLPDDSNRPQLDKETYLESFRYESSLYAENRIPQLHAPLVPLTPARQIRNVMGNIIRTVSAEPSYSGSGGSSEETQPASAELEQAVTAFFAASDLQPQPVSVWALIVPSPLPAASAAKSESTYRLLGLQDEDLRALWKSKDCSTLVDSVLNHVLPAGARLRKVLSGGGGWGKKAGLLSLDPDDRYSTRELRKDEGWEMDVNEDLREQQKQALGEAAKDGESVMFFLAPEGLAGYEGNPTDHGQGNLEDLIIDFGSLPSSIDTVPAAPSAAQDGAPTAVNYQPNLLGAFSEGGLALTLEDAEKTKRKTKFDVPYSRVNAHGSKPRLGSTKPRSERRHYSTTSARHAKAKPAER